MSEIKTPREYAKAMKQLHRLLDSLRDSSPVSGPIIAIEVKMLAAEIQAYETMCERNDARYALRLMSTRRTLTNSERAFLRFEQERAKSEPWRNLEEKQ